MKTTILTKILALMLIAGSANASETHAQPSFESFWAKLKAAVIKKDKASVLKYSKLPFYMPYGVKTIRSARQFRSNYSFIFNGEADAVKCFATATPEKLNAKRYEVACGFKDDPTGAAGKPIVYAMELSRNGWRLVGLDNINE